MIRLWENGSLILNDYIVVADIHFGDFFIYDLDLLEEYTYDMLESIFNLAKSSGKEKIIINGDVKESIGMPNRLIYRYLTRFMEEITENFDEIIIIKGNHDGKIEKIISSLNNAKKIKIAKEMVIKNILIMHGHRKVDLNMLEKISTIVVGHIHPAIRFPPTKMNVGCWLLMKLGYTEQKREISLIVMPAYSRYTYGLAINSLEWDELASLIPIKVKDKAKVKIKKLNILLKDLTPFGEREFDEGGSIKLYR